MYIKLNKHYKSEQKDLLGIPVEWEIRINIR